MTRAAGADAYVSSGASAVYSTRWLQVGRCSPAPPWRTSSTSSSGYWVSGRRPHPAGGWGWGEGLASHWHNGVLRFSRHTHRGELARNLVRGGVQILQLPQVQTAATDQPRSQVALVCRLPVKKISYDFFFGLFVFYISFLLGLCGAWVFFVTHMSVTGRKSCFSQTAMHFLPLTSLWPPTSPQAINLTLFLSLPGWTAKASSCCFHSSKWVCNHPPPPNFYHVTLFSGSLYIIIVYMSSYLNHLKLNLIKCK